MFKNNVDNAISLLNQLLEVTNQDIENIKNAKHDQVDESVKLKNDLIKKFEATKTSIDNDLFAMLSQKEGADLANVLDEDDKDKLGEFKNLLKLLQEKNREYARYVALIKEYFTSLTREIFGKNFEIYGQNTQAFNSNLKIRV